MLVFTRKVNESIIFGDDEIDIKILDTKRGEVKLGITCPRDIDVNRYEIFLRKKKDDKIKRIFD